MAIQGAVEATIVIKEENSFGVAPAAGSAQRLRRVSSSLAGKKASYASNEVRSDQQVSDMRHGARSVGGSIETELAMVAGGVHLESLLTGLMRGTWAAGVSCAPADFATGVTVADSGSVNSVLTFAGAGNLVTKGFRLGDMVRLSGFNGAGNNNKNLRIVNVTSTGMTLFPRITAQAQQAAGWSVAVQGRKLLMGQTKRSFTIEQSYADASVYELFTGMRVAGANFNVPPAGMATASFDFLGQQFAPSGAAYFTTPTAETVGGNLDGVGGALRINGAELGIVTSFQMSIQNNLSQPPVIGSVISPEIFMGRLVATGSVTAFLDSISLLDAFSNETEVDIVCVCEGNGPAPEEFLAFNVQRAKFSASDHTIGPDGGVLLQLPFQALLASANNKDVSSVVLQRSTV